MEQKRHITKATHDEEFWRFVNTDNSKYLDWAVVGLFYSAMHFIDGFFGKKGKHLKSHDIADKEIAQDKQLVNIYAHYRKLKDCRWKASYWLTRFSKSEIDKNIVPHFDRIKSFILESLSN